jgi:hypothetical protein
MLKRKLVEEIATSLSIKGQGEEFKFNVTFHNRSQKELENHLAENPNEPSDTLLFIVKDWESEYPLTKEGISEMESDRPGMVIAMIYAFHDARKVEKEKN